MYVLDVKAEGYNHIKFEVPTSDAVGNMVQLLYMLGVGVAEITVTYRDESPIDDGSDGNV